MKRYILRATFALATVATGVGRGADHGPSGHATASPRLGPRAYRFGPDDLVGTAFTIRRMTYPATMTCSACRSMIHRWVWIRPMCKGSSW
jgi:hypothetical protein